MQNDVKSLLEEEVKDNISVLKRIDLKEIEDVVNILYEAYKNKRTIFALGNGGSASTATHFVSDLSKFASNDKPLIKAVDICSNVSLHTAWINDDSWNDVWSNILSPWIDKSDVLVLFSVHGGTKYSGNLNKVIEKAKSKGAFVIGFSGDGGGAFNELCDINVSVPNPDNDNFITPITESVHVALHHYICSALRDLIKNEG